MRRMSLLTRLLASVVAAALLLATAVALARPGGGQAFSGGSRSDGYGSSGYGGSGGGNGFGFLVQLLFWLIFDKPAIGIPLVVIAIAFVIVKSVMQSSMQAWSTTSAQVDAVEQEQRRATVRRSELDAIRSIDPAFSAVLFEDFAYMLYAAVHRARAAGTESIAAYLAPDLAQNLRDASVTDVRGIIIGAMRYVRFSGIQGSTIDLEIEFEANFVEAQPSGERRLYVVDRMALSRSRTARSRPFARAAKLDCPNCGAPLEALRGTQCAYCRQDVGYGRFDWMVVSFRNISTEPRGPLLTSDVRETGTELPTLVDPGAGRRLQDLQTRDPQFAWQALQGRIGHIFDELGAGWSARDPMRIRPYVSDNLFQSMLYWLDLYTQAQCRNITDNSRILRIDLANVLSDQNYDAVTVRVFASGLDYTISDNGRVLSGSRMRPRTYSEYWTLIRGTQRKGQPRGNVNCPNCGAPLRIGMAGNCEYCQVKVTAGEFDWVLSRIEQDEAYAG